MKDLIEFARHEFRLSKLGADGVSLRDTLKTVERQTGKMPAEGINPVAMPLELLYIWKWFADLHAARPVGVAPGPLLYSEMLAYFSLMRVTPREWEITVIRALDGASRNPEK